MKTKAFPLLILAAALLFALGCSSPRSQYGKKEVSLLGGLVEAKQGAYEEVGAMTFHVKSSDVNPGAKLGGSRVSFLWGALVFADQ